MQGLEPDQKGTERCCGRSGLRGVRGEKFFLGLDPIRFGIAGKTCGEAALGDKKGLQLDLLEAGVGWFLGCRLGSGLWFGSGL